MILLLISGNGLLRLFERGTPSNCVRVHILNGTITRKSMTHSQHRQSNIFIQSHTYTKYLLCPPPTKMSCGTWPFFKVGTRMRTYGQNLPAAPATFGCAGLAGNTDTSLWWNEKARARAVVPQGWPSLQYNFPQLHLAPDCTLPLDRDGTENIYSVTYRIVTQGRRGRGMVFIRYPSPS